MNYQTSRNTRRESRTLIGRFRGGKQVPVMAVAVRGNEGGMLSQSITMELDPIAGRMITPISAEFTSVFVPVQGIDAIKDPDAAYAGITEVIREKFISGNPLFGLENESEISKRCGVNPRSVILPRRPSGVDRQICGLDGTIGKLRKRLSHLDLLIIDDFALSPMSKQELSELLEIIEDRSTRSSTIITAQRAPEEWHDFIGDPLLADAFMDRVRSRAYFLQLKGGSMR